MIFIIWFSRGEIDQVNDGSFILSSVVEFIQILPFRFHPLWNFLLISIDISQEIKLISLTYVIKNCSSDKKDCQTFKNYSLRTQLGKKTGQASSATPNIKFNLFPGIYKRDCKLSRTFFFFKYQKFWLSYEWFSAFCEILLPKRAISRLKQKFLCTTSGLFSWFQSFKGFWA